MNCSKGGTYDVPLIFSNEREDGNGKWAPKVYEIHAQRL